MRGGAQGGTSGDNVVDHEHAPFGTAANRAGSEPRTDEAIGSVSAGLWTTGQASQKSATRNPEVSRHPTSDDLRLVEPPAPPTAIGGWSPGDQIERAADADVVAHGVGEFVGEQS